MIIRQSVPPRPQSGAPLVLRLHRRDGDDDLSSKVLTWPRLRALLLSLRPGIEQVAIMQGKNEWVWERGALVRWRHLDGGVKL